MSFDIVYAVLVGLLVCCVVFVFLVVCIVGLLVCLVSVCDFADSCCLGCLCGVLLLVSYKVFWFGCLFGCLVVVGLYCCDWVVLIVLFIMLVNGCVGCCLLV